MTISIGEELKRLRLAAGYQTLGDLYRSSRVTVSTLSRLEAGIQKPSPSTLKKLAPCLGVSYEELMVSAGYLPSPGQIMFKDAQGSYGVVDIDEILADDSRPVRLGGRVLSPEVRQVLKDNLNLIKRLIASQQT